MLVFPKKFEEKMSSFGEMRAFYIFNYLQGFFYRYYKKMTWVVMIKSQLLRFLLLICTSN